MLKNYNSNILVINLFFCQTSLITKNILERGDNNIGSPANISKEKIFIN